MHLQSKEAFAHLEVALPYLRTCEVLALELDLEQASQQADPSPSLLPNQQRLSQLLTPKKYQKLKRMIQKVNGIDLAHFDRLLPILTANYISASFLPPAHPLTLDQHLFRVAQKEQIQAIGLEDLQSQSNILQNMPIEDQLRELVHLGKNISSTRRRFLKIARLYEEGELQRLYQAIRKSNGGQREALIFARNRSMEKTLSEYLLQHSVFCAVGAGHLGGYWGLPALFKRSGWRVSPITTNKSTANR